jgi:VanZ family protein
MAMLFGFSSLSTLPAPPGDLTEYHVHFGAYAGLSVVTVRALAMGRWRHVTLSVACGAVAISSIYGVTDEYHQLFVPGRTFDRLDLLADALGSLLGGAALWGWSIIKRRSETRDVL